LACWINAVAIAQGPAFPQGAPNGGYPDTGYGAPPAQGPMYPPPPIPGGPVPGEYAPPQVAPPPGSPGVPSTYAPITQQPAGPGAPPIRPGETIVANVVFEGIKTVRYGSLPKLGTRQGQPYDPQIVEKDVKLLMKSRKFVDVSPYTASTPQGVVVTFRVVERATIHYIKMVGNQEYLTSTLIGKTDLKVGDGMDPYSIKEARDKLEAHYHEHGMPAARVTIIEGNNPGDKGAIFLIDEGKFQRVWWTKFIGNTIASSARLRTQIDTKPPILYIFKGYVDQAKIDEDVQKLTAYYRGLGFFQASVGRELEFDEKQNWVTVTFVINEGPRYKVRSVAFIGNEKIGRDTLFKDLKLTGGQFFNQGAMNHDLNSVRDLYGGKGYVFANIQPDPRLLEGQAELDLIYNVEEGSRYRVGKINVTIAGDSTHTHSRTIYDRLSLRPGDILDTRKLRGDERRLKASQIFAADPAKAPKITFSPLGGTDAEKALAERPGDRKRRFGMPGSTGASGAMGSNNYRGQSPDNDDGYAVIDVGGSLLPGADRRWDLDPMPASRTAYALPSDRPVNYEAPISGDVWNRIQGQVYSWPAAPRTRQPIVRGQSPDAGRNAPVNYRAQAPAGGWAVQPTDPDSMQRIARYQPPPTNGSYPNANYGQQSSTPYGSAPAGYGNSSVPAASPAGYTTYPAPAGQPNVYWPSASASSPSSSYTAGPTDGAPRTAYQPPPTGYVPSGVAPVYPPGTLPPGGTVAPPGVAPEQIVPGQPIVQGGPQFEPWLPVDVFTNETTTGKLMVGIGVNSDAGLIGNVVIDEQNFDISRWPTSWEDFRDGTAFRGAGQRFRIEASPGTRVQRYVLSFQEPYLFDTPVSLSTSVSYFTRIYENWDESRVGGRFGLGYAFTPDLIGNFGFRIENIRISNPTTPTPPELERVLGHNFAYGFYTGFAHDTRDNPFLASQGHILRVNYEQIWGDFTYPQVTIEGRQYFKIAERPDGSGKHVLGIGSVVGFSGSDTPIYDEFFAGGFSTLRGFVFRAASPLDMGVQVGGNFEFLNTAEYVFPITADDVLRGVAFVDFGTVEPTTEIKGQDFRIAPGLGLRIAIPALGPAPIALDFAVPVHHAPGDREEIFSFSISGVR
jgi:outer membrane protein insertion porin family